MLTGEAEPRSRAAQELLELGPKAVVAKQGKYGATLFTDEDVLRAAGVSARAASSTRPARATRSRAASSATSRPRAATRATRRCSRAMAYGTALASFNVEEFGTERVTRLTADEIAERVAELQRMTTFAEAPVALRG